MTTTRMRILRCFLFLISTIHITGNATAAVHNVTVTAVATDSGNDPQVDTRIVGGHPLGQGWYPWFGVSTRNSLCGATLIHDDVLLTAAHCGNAWDYTPVGATGVLIGTTSRVQPYDASVEPRRLVAKVPHPLYNGFTNVFDFMLVKLDSPVTTIAPIRLPAADGSDDPDPNDVLTVIGYGRTTENGLISNQLRYVDVNAISYGACASSYGQLVDNVMLCAGIPGVGGKDACQGDSGGPIFSTVWQNEVIQVGVTSFGTGCARANYPGVYSRVSTAVPWIRETLCSLSSIPPSHCYNPVTPQPVTTTTLAPNTPQPTLAPTTPQPVTPAPVTPQPTHAPLPLPTSADVQVVVQYGPGTAVAFWEIHRYVGDGWKQLAYSGPVGEKPPNHQEVAFLADVPFGEYQATLYDARTGGSTATLTLTQFLPGNNQLPIVSMSGFFQTQKSRDFVVSAEGTTLQPTDTPTASPVLGSPSPTPLPTKAPTRFPTQSPTRTPTNPPTLSPTHVPTRNPTSNPTRNPTLQPTKVPTHSPTSPAPVTPAPTLAPTLVPTPAPTNQPLPVPGSTAALKIVVRYDDKPWETGWTIQQGFFNLFGGPHLGFTATAGGEEVYWWTDAPYGTYRFRIVDTARDGLDRSDFFAIYQVPNGGGALETIAASTAPFGGYGHSQEFVVQELEATAAPVATAAPTTPVPTLLPTRVPTLLPTPAPVASTAAPVVSTPSPVTPSPIATPAPVTPAPIAAPTPAPVPLPTSGHIRMTIHHDMNNANPRAWNIHPEGGGAPLGSSSFLVPAADTTVEEWPTFPLGSFVVTIFDTFPGPSSDYVVIEQLAPNGIDKATLVAGEIGFTFSYNATFTVAATLPSSPTPLPTPLPTRLPTPLPTPLPTLRPTPQPSPAPTPLPSRAPTPQPSLRPSDRPSTFGAVATPQPSTLMPVTPGHALVKVVVRYDDNPLETGWTVQSSSFFNLFGGPQVTPAPQDEEVHWWSAPYGDYRFRMVNVNSNGVNRSDFVSITQIPDGGGDPVVLVESLAPFTGYLYSEEFSVGDLIPSAEPSARPSSRPTSSTATIKLIVMYDSSPDHSDWVITQEQPQPDGTTATVELYNGPDPLPQPFEVVETVFADFPLGFAYSMTLFDNNWDGMEHAEYFRIVQVLDDGSELLLAVGDHTFFYSSTASFNVTASGPEP